MTFAPDRVGVGRADDIPSWAGKPDTERRLTLDQVRSRCALLGPPGHNRLPILVESTRPAAVLAPVTELDGEAALIVTKRPATMVHHRNDWVFPGGRVDARDLDSRATAVREASEELGVPACRIEVIGQLATHGPIVTGYVIDTFVGLVNLADLAPDPGEVSDWTVLPISALTAPDAYRRSHTMPQHDTGPTATGGVSAQRVASGNGMAFFKIQGDEELWGTQGEMLFELLHWIFLTNAQSDEDR